MLCAWANSYLKGLSVTMLTAAASASPLQALEHPGLLLWSCRPHCLHMGSQIWAKLARLPDGFGFRSNHDPTGWPSCGMPQHPPAPPISHALVGFLKVLKRNLLLLCFVNFCVPCGASQARAQWGTPMQCLVVQKQSGRPPIGGCRGASRSFLAGGWSH